MPSQLGYGETDKPDDPRQYTFRSTALDNDAIMRELGVTGKYLVGGHDAFAEPLIRLTVRTLGWFTGLARLSILPGTSNRGRGHLHPLECAYAGEA